MTAIGGMMMTAVKNRFKKVASELEFNLRNTNINGRKVGCAGFVSNPENGRVIYLDTEEGFNYKVLYRVADSTKDYTGKANQLVLGKMDADDFVGRVAGLLTTTTDEEFANTARIPNRGTH